MKFKIFASFNNLDWDGNFRPQDGWTDHEIIVFSNSRKNAKKKVWEWARKRGASQRQLQIVDDLMWKRDKSYKTRFLK